MNISSKWRHFCFSECSLRCTISFGQPYYFDPSPWNALIKLRSVYVPEAPFTNNQLGVGHGSLITFIGFSSVQLPQGLNCRPGPCEGVTGAMSASRVVCKVVHFTVKQHQLHAPPLANELSSLLEPKFLATPAICSSQSGVEVNLSRQRRFEV